MNMRHAIPLIVLLVCCLVPAIAQSTARPRSQAAPTLSQRLVSLDPDDAAAYFLLGEDLGYAPNPSPEQRQLARQLLLLAAIIDRESAQPSGLDYSAALALADLAGNERERRWLLATAEAIAIDAAATAPSLRWPVAVAAVGSDDLNLRVAEALARARANDGVRVQREMLRSPIEQTLLRSGVSAEDTRSIISELNIVVGTRQCPGCRNDRTVRTRTSDGRLAINRCPICRGNPGASLSEAQYLTLIRAEAKVVGVDAENWSTDLFLSQQQPLHDTGFDELLRRYQIDPAARVWQPTGGPARPGSLGGHWITRTPAASDAAG